MTFGKSTEQGRAAQAQERKNEEERGQRLRRDQPPLPVKHFQRVLQVGLDHFAENQTDCDRRHGEAEAAHEVSDHAEYHHDPNILQRLVKRISADHGQ